MFSVKIPTVSVPTAAAAPLPTGSVTDAVWVDVGPFSVRIPWDAAEAVTPTPVGAARVPRTTAPATPSTSTVAAAVPTPGISNDDGTTLPRTSSAAAFPATSPTGSVDLVDLTLANDTDGGPTLAVGKLVKTHAKLHDGGPIVL